MAFRFRRTMKIAPGVRLNLTKTGISARVGPKGAGVTVGTSGTTVSAGIPGTGLHVSEKVKTPKGTRTPSKTVSVNTKQPSKRSNLSWLDTSFWIFVIGLFGLVFWANRNDEAGLGFLIAILSITPLLAIALLVWSYRKIRRWLSNRKSVREVVTSGND